MWLKDFRGNLQIHQKREKLEMCGRHRWPSSILKKFLWNLWKLSEVFTSLQKSLEIFGKFQKICHKVVKRTYKHFFFKSLEIIGSLQTSSEVFRKLGKWWKVLKTIFWLTLFENFQKFSEISESVRKCLENFGIPQKIFECTYYLRFLKTFYNTPISDTYGLKIRFKNFE